jgi:hypothetical protein
MRRPSPRRWLCRRRPPPHGQPAGRRRGPAAGPTYRSTSTTTMPATTSLHGRTSRSAFRRPRTGRPPWSRPGRPRRCRDGRLSRRLCRSSRCRPSPGGGGPVAVGLQAQLTLLQAGIGSNALGRVAAGQLRPVATLGGGFRYLDGPLEAEARAVTRGLGRRGRPGRVRATPAGPGPSPSPTADA